MKTAVSIPDPLFASAERMAKRLGISRSELFQRALEEFVRRRQADAITAMLDAVYADESRDAPALDPVLASLQLASLDAADWK